MPKISGKVRTPHSPPSYPHLTSPKVVAEGIRGDPITFNEAILGYVYFPSPSRAYHSLCTTKDRMEPDKYITTITKPSTWGGAIELTVLARHFGVEISSVDVETGRVDHFEPEGGADTRCVLIYSGIHYDAASVAPMIDAPNEWHQTVFPIVRRLSSHCLRCGADAICSALPTTPRMRLSSPRRNSPTSYVPSAHTRTRRPSTSSVRTAVKV